MPITVTVVICAYELGRWEQTVEAVASVLTQSTPVDEVVLVIDHNPELLARACEAWQSSAVSVVSSSGAQGLSGARNTGVGCASSEIVAFLDDDAAAEPTWIEHLMKAYSDPHVVACGGAVLPALEGDRPSWWPLEFDWVIGCSYRGLPAGRADVRNVIGANMSARRDAVVRAGGFSEGIGRVGTRPVGCEETDLCIRLAQAGPGTRVVYEPAARVHHRVPAARLSWAYFRARCLAEGLSKSLVAARVGSADALASERTHALKVLPVAMLRALADGAPQRSLAIASGLFLTTAGYARGRLAAPAPTLPRVTTVIPA